MSATVEAAEETEPEASTEIEMMPQSTANNVIDLEQWIIAAGEIEERKQEREPAKAESPASFSGQPSFLQEPNTSGPDAGEPDSRKPREQRSLFSEPLPTGEPENKRTKKKPTGYTYQSQLAFNFSEPEPPQSENLGAASQAA